MIHIEHQVSRRLLLGGAVSVGFAIATKSVADATQSAVVGAWRLETFNERVADGSFKPRFGADPVGYLIYTASGRVSATLSATHRPRFESGATSSAADACNESMRDFLAYAGRYEIRGDEVFHHIEASIFTNLVGTTLKRGFQLRGDTLTIRTLPPYIWGSQSVLVWRRTTS